MSSRPGTRVRLLLVDDHGLFRDGLSRLLADEPDLEVVGQCSSIGEMTGELRRALCVPAESPRAAAGAFQTPDEGAAARPPDRIPLDLILLDYDLGESNGLHALQVARALGFTGRVLLVTAGMGPAELQQALAQGASGLFLKHSPPSELVRAIHQVMRGEPWPDRVSLKELTATAERESPGSLRAAFRAPGAAPRPPALTPRERAVLRGVFEGLLNKEIAVELGASEGSVKAVLQQLFAKTGVRSRAQLVRIALENRYEYELDDG